MPAEEVIAAAKQKMTAIISSIADIKHKDILQLAEQNKNFVFVSMGLHPSRIANYSDEEIDNYLQSIRDNKDKIVAIGECGLDYLQVEKDKRKRAEEVFIKFIKLAAELKLPLVIHTRDKPNSNVIFDDVLNIVSNNNASSSIPIVFHCFSGSEGQLKKALSHGYYISIATLVCKSDKHKRLAEKTPLENMLLETDSPWMHPRTKAMINRPWLIEESAKVIARIKNTLSEKILQQTTENAKKVFKLGV